jgi:DNA polymerase III subunit delta
VQASRLYSMKKISLIISLIKNSDLKTKGVGGSNSNDKDVLRQLIIEIMN